MITAKPNKYACNLNAKRFWEARVEAERARKVKVERAKMAAIRKARAILAQNQALGQPPTPTPGTTMAGLSSAVYTSGFTNMPVVYKSTSPGAWSLVPTSSSAGTCTSPTSYGISWAWSDDTTDLCYKHPPLRRVLAAGVDYDLPNGSRLAIDDDGNYKIENEQQQITYRANTSRAFNPYINAGDMMAKFVEEAVRLGVARDEVLKLPINLFISWLIIAAAEQDGEERPADIVPISADPLLLSVVRPKCLQCGRFIPRLYHRNRFPFCNPEHATKRLQLA